MKNKSRWEISVEIGLLIIAAVICLVYLAVSEAAPDPLLPPNGELTGAGFWAPLPPAEQDWLPGNILLIAGDDIDGESAE